MQFSKATVCFVLFSWTIETVQATCTSSDQRCQQGGGDCTTAVRLALGGDLAAAQDSLFYGNYCGRTNRCIPIEELHGDDDDYSDEEDNDEFCLIEKESTSKKGKKKANDRKLSYITSSTEEAGEPCPATPCDEIDRACQQHDACLDNIIFEDQIPPEDLPIPVPRRCKCDVEFVYNQVIISQSQDLTGFCDEAFYEEPLAPSLPLSGVGLLQHEALLQAAGSCCSLLADNDGNEIADCQEDGDTDPTQYAVASGFCQQFVGGLSGFGIEIC